MTREFTEKTPTRSGQEIELRDFIAMLMPTPPYGCADPRDEAQQLWAEMKARYAYADRIIKEIRK